MELRMSTSSQTERSIKDALYLLTGWLYVLGGVGILIFSRFSEWKETFMAIGMGALFLVPVYYRERRGKVVSNPNA
jgi:hypothetical protein